MCQTSLNGDGVKRKEGEKKKKKKTKDILRTCAKDRSGRDSRSSREEMHDEDNEVESIVLWFGPITRNTRIIREISLSISQQ